MFAIFCPKSSKILDGFVEFLGQKVPLTFKVNFLMYNPLSLDTLRLGRDPIQSLSTFYSEVRKLEHLEGQFFWPIRHANGTSGPIFGSKTAKTFCRGH